MSFEPSASTPQPAPPPPFGSQFWTRFRDLGSLRRASRSRVFGGVAEGLSRHFDIDPVIVRVLFVALAFFGCAGILLYLVLWLTVPRDDQTHSVVSGRRGQDPRPVVTAGLAIGGILAAAVFLGSVSWAVPHPFPLLVVVAAVALVVLALARRRDASTPTAPPPPPPPGWAGPPPAHSGYGGGAHAQPGAPWGPAPWNAPGEQQPPVPAPATSETPETGGTEAGDTDPVTPGPLETTDTVTSVIAPADQQPTAAWWQRTEPPPPTWQAPPSDLQPPPPPPARPRSHLFAVTMASAALAIAGMWIADATTSWDPNPSVYPGVVLGIVAAALLVSVRWGRSRGLIAVGFVAALATLVAGFAGPGPYGDLVHDPARAAQLRPSYSLGAGQLTLHLEDVSDIAALEGRTTRIDARFGRVVVIVPSTVAATVDMTVDHGDLIGVTSWQDIGEGGQHTVLRPPADGRPTMRIVVHATYGEIEVQRAACPGAGFALGGESTKTWKGDTRVAAACH